MHLDHPGISLTLAPCAILLKPLNSKANAPKAIGGREGDSGNTMITMARDIISGPSPMFASLVDLFPDGNAMPTAILSNPIINRTAETIRIIVCVVIPGYVRVTIVNIMAVTPKPSSKNLNHPRDFFSFLLLLLLFEGVSVVKHHLQE